MVKFYNRKNGKCLCEYTLEGTFPGEMQATIELLAYENGIEPVDIEVIVSK